MNDLEPKMFSNGKSVMAFASNREIRRMPLDFKWPVGVIWKGYLNPYRSHECKACGGSGHNPETKKLADTWYDTWYNNGGSKDGCWHDKITQDEVEALVHKGRLSNFLPNEDKHYYDDDKKCWIAWRDGKKVKLKEAPKMPTADEVNRRENESGLGCHDAINRWICVETRAKRLGVWGECELCGGHGDYWCDDKFRKKHENWERIEPPVGTGYQMWETTDEGAPKTPVFESIEELAHYCADHDVSYFGHDTLPYDRWLEMFENAL